MDSLKGTVVLFTPHTSQVINKDAARACSSEAAASKLFKASVGLHTVGHLPIPIHGTPRLPIPIHGRKCKNMTQKLTFGSRSVASYLARQCCFQSVMKTLRHSAQRLLVLGLPVVLWTVMWCLVYLEFAWSAFQSVIVQMQCQGRNRKRYSASSQHDSPLTRHYCIAPYIDSSTGLGFFIIMKGCTVKVCLAAWSSLTVRKNSCWGVTVSVVSPSCHTWDIYDIFSCACEGK